jgi:hypothetical protein
MGACRTRRRCRSDRPPKYPEPLTQPILQALDPHRVNDEDAVVKIGNDHHVPAPMLWAWITMRAPLDFQDSDAFRQAHGLARRLAELDHQEQLSRWVDRLTDFLADYDEIPLDVKGGIRAQLYNAARPRLPGGSDDIVESALYGETTAER